jgi:hypothetical protein
LKGLDSTGCDVHISWTTSRKTSTLFQKDWNWNLRPRWRSYHLFFVIFRRL